jgi:hypothetical protein
METLSPPGARGKSEPFATPSSTGTAADGGWRRWWEYESECAGSDWVSLIAAASEALHRLRVLHAAVPSS